MDLFNPAPPTVMHVDINSCFATIEQQANPRLRGKPVVVAAYTTGNGCILTASVEAKRLGVKTGMMVREGRAICPQLTVLPSDPNKYRAVNHKLADLLGSYTADMSVESIDEMVMSLKDTPKLVHYMKDTGDPLEAMQMIAREIMLRIKQEIGEWITVSCGIAPNRYLAKVASGLQKPDGLRWITKENIQEVFEALELEDLCGIKRGNADRLRLAGIYSPATMLLASRDHLTRGFQSILGGHWWLRLHGWEDGSMYKPFGTSPDGQTPFAQGSGGSQKSFGQSFAMPIAYAPSDPKLWQLLSQLVMKMGRRMRRDGFVARGVAVSLSMVNFGHWHNQALLPQPIFADSDFYYAMRHILRSAPSELVKLLAITCYRLENTLYHQESLLVDENRKRQLTRAMDAMHDRFGSFVITPARMLHMEKRVLDRIAFGKAGLST